MLRKMGILLILTALSLCALPTSALGIIPDKPVFGDWDGNNTTTIGVYRPSPKPAVSAQWFLRNKNSGGEPEVSFEYGGYGDIPVFGDWDGNNTVTPGVYRPSPKPAVSAEWLLRNKNSGGTPEITIKYGGYGDLPVFGDWNADGETTIGVFRSEPGKEAKWLLRNSNSSGEPESIVPLGAYGDIPVFGDWRGENYTELGIYRPSPAPAVSAEWFLGSGGLFSPIELEYGGYGDKPVFGDWDGNNTTTVGVFRPSPGEGKSAQWLLRNKNSGGTPEITISYGGYTE